MTDTPTIRDELDNILHRAGLAEGFYRISTADKSTVNVLSDTDTYDETKQAINAYILGEVMAIIGDNQNELAVPHKAVGEFGENKIMGMPDRRAIARNELRQELRNKANKRWGK